MVQIDNEVTCLTCRFWGGSPRKNGPGACRRRSPVVLVGQVEATAVNCFDGVFPHTHETDWCGEYEQDPDS